MLTNRRAKILALIVDDYVTTANPVGSKAIVARHQLPMSSATVRNEMAALEDEGLITHPHTSAGRIPSDKGYRYYVETLMPDRSLPRDEQYKILHQFHQATQEIEQWLHLAASVLSTSLNQMAMITPPRLKLARLRNLQLVSLQEHSALLVAVTEDARVSQRPLHLPLAADQDELSRLSHRLNALVAGKTAVEIEAEAQDLSETERLIAEAVAALMRVEDDEALEAPRTEGLRNVLSQPEFARNERTLEMIEALEERNINRSIPFEDVDTEGVTIFIGAENRESAMKDCSLILARYGLDGGMTGVVGVLGPTRMDYQGAVSSVQYLANVMSELTRELYE
jgi:heat-inducible transcriptional repressor